jgi:hypothetical protein
MRRLIGIIFFFVFISSYSQLDTPFLFYSFDNTLIDSALTGNDLKAYGNATFDASTKYFGSHSVVFDGSGDYFRVPVADYGATFFISFWGRSTGSVNSINRYFFSIADGSDYFQSWVAVTDQVRANSTSNSAYYGIWTGSAWHNIVLAYRKSDGVMRIYVDGARAAQIDSTVGTTFNSNDSLYIGVDEYKNSGWYGNIDEFRVYKGSMPTEAQVDSLYELTYRNSDCPSMTGGTIAASQTIDAGDDIAAFTSGGNASGGTGSITYSWLYSTTSSVAGSGDWTVITDSTKTTLNYGVVNFTTYFVRKATAATCGAAYSNVLQVIVNVEDAGVSYGYDSTLVIACHQKFAIPEDVNNSDVVGTFQKNITYSCSDYSFAITTNPNNAYAISSSTGVITIADATQIDGQITSPTEIEYLMITTTDNSLGTSELDTAEIWIKEVAYCTFIDYSQGVDGSGTRASPEKDIDDFAPSGAITAGRGYFFKRGTIMQGETTAIVGKSATSANPTIWGAYGTGDKPKFQSGSSYCFLLGSYSYDVDRVDYMYFFDLHIRNYTTSVFYVLPPSNNLGWYNCDVFNNSTSQASGSPHFVLHDVFPEYDKLDSNRVYEYELINIDFDTATTTWPYIKGQPHLVQNCSFTNKTAVASNSYLLRFGSGTSGTVKHCIFDGGTAPTTAESHASIQLRMDDVTFYDCQFISLGGGIYITDPGASASLTEAECDEVFPDSLHIYNCLFRRQGAYAIYYYPSATSRRNHSVGNIIENSLFDSPVNGLFFKDTDNSIIRRNIFKDGSTYAITASSTSSEGSDNNSIYYNVIYDYGSDEIRLPLGTGLTVYNNTVVGAIVLTGSTSPVVRNNFYSSSTTNTSDNIDLDAITTGDYFSDYAGHNYYLKSTATLAIDEGYSVGLSPDIAGTAVPQRAGTDIGAFEFLDSQPEPPKVITIPPGHRIIVIQF